jgi:hypothetical protein
MRKTQRSDRPNAASPASPSSPSVSATDLKRRGFLLTLGVGGVGAAVVAARSMTGAVVDAEPDAATPSDGKGYAVTDHVKRYYRTMKV